MVPTQYRNLANHVGFGEEFLAGRCSTIRVGQRVVVSATRSDCLCSDQLDFAVDQW